MRKIKAKFSNLKGKIGERFENLEGKNVRKIKMKSKKPGWKNMKTSDRLNVASTLHKVSNLRQFT